MTHARVLSLSLAAALAAAGLAGCRAGADRQAQPAALGELLAPHRGKVVLLLLGREGCPGTRRATETLDRYAPEKPARVEILRVDVPLPGEDYRPAPGWAHGYRRTVDRGRRLARELDFFFYPTLYILDGAGELRFAGGCDAARVRAMVGEILAEQPGAPKKVYTLPLVAEGRGAPDFRARGFDGRERGLAELRGARATLLFFSDTACPFTVAELDNLRLIAEAGRSHGVAVAIVSRGAGPDQGRKVYEERAAGIPVVNDADGAIFRAYGVDGVPFYYLLDGGGLVVRRRSFTPEAASNAVNVLLGLADEKLRFKPTEAG